MGRKWTDEEESALCRAYLEGVAIRDIAKALKRTESALEYRLWLLRKQLPYRLRRWSAREIEAVRAGKKVKRRSAMAIRVKKCRRDNK